MAPRKTAPKPIEPPEPVAPPEPEAPPAVVDDGLPHVHRPYTVMREREDEVFLKVDNHPYAQGTWVRKADLDNYEGF